MFKGTKMLAFGKTRLVPPYLSGPLSEASLLILDEKVTACWEI